MSSRFESAIKEYLWQIFQFSSQLWVHIAIFETTLRETINRALRTTYQRDDWWQIKGFLRKSEQQKVAFYSQSRSKTTLKRQNFVNKSTLGFWTALFTRNYHHRIWIQISEQIPNLKKTDRLDFLNKLKRIKNLRDAIAHHVPILDRNIPKDLDYLCELTNLLSPIMGEETQTSSAKLKKRHHELTHS